MLAMKGKRPVEELAALPRGFRVSGVHPVALPGLDDERHIVELSPVRRVSPAKAVSSARPTPSKT